MESAFIAIYCESNFYKNYEQISEDKRDFILPLVLMMNRWDGKIGFIGGHVDQGESLIDCIVRELKEEIGHSLESSLISDIQFVCSHSTKKQTTHLFSLSVTENIFRQMLKGQHDAIHYLAEGTCSAIHYINYPHNHSFDNFLMNHFAPTVKEEIYALVEFLKWNDKYNIKKHPDKKLR